MEKHKIDSIDFQILKDLQDNGRITTVELAKRANISVPPCVRRLKALEEAEFITGYHAMIDPKKIGFSLIIFVDVSLKSQSNYAIKTFEEEMEKHLIVRECHMTTGEGDFLLKIVVKDFETYHHFFTNVLSSHPEFLKAKTKIIAQSKVKKGLIPF